MIHLSFVMNGVVHFNSTTPLKSFDIDLNLLLTETP